MGRPRPPHTAFEEKLAIAMAVNGLVQLALDIIFEALHLLPTRVNHLSLTFLNAFISFKTLSAIRRDRFSFMHEDCQILWLMEICLILGDVYQIGVSGFTFYFFYIRLFFLVCSLFNYAVVTYIIWKYELWSLSYKGHSRIEGPTATALALTRQKFGASCPPIGSDEGSVRVEYNDDGVLSDDECMDIVEMTTDIEKNVQKVQPPRTRQLVLTPTNEPDLNGGDENGDVIDVGFKGESQVNLL